MKGNINTMTTQHTPGEWKAYPLFDALRHPKGYAISSLPTGDFIATVEETEPPSLALANARLIAAAPKLLHALQGILNGDSPNWVDVAKTAIAKATGKETI